MAEKLAQKPADKKTAAPATAPERGSTQKAKLKGKNWYPIIAPKIFGSQELGQTLAREEKELIGRRIDIGVAELTNDPSKFYIKAIFEIHNVADGKAGTRFAELDTLKDFISRMIQRRIRRVDSVNRATTKDNVDVVVKTVGISIRRINNSMKSQLRKEINKVVQEHVKNVTLDELITNIINGALQVEVRKHASKTYPLRGCEVRRMQVLRYPE
jgi:ribosomal protein S3AE